MSNHNILITGASGYLGGTLLARLQAAKLPPHGHVHALVRSEEQASKVKQYQVEPLQADLKDETKLTSTIIEHEISIIFYLVDAMDSHTQVVMIKALAEVKIRTGKDVHFLHTTGAKLFSSHVGHPTDRPLPDTDPELYTIQNSHKGPFENLNQAVRTNSVVIDEAEAAGVRSYIFAPCIVYGKGEGFGNPTSIQTVAIVKAAKALRQVYQVTAGNPTWPVCHVGDNAELYLQILRKILQGEAPGHGRGGYYLAASGSVAWNDIYKAFAKSMAARNIVDNETVVLADDTALEKMSAALSCPKDFVAVQLAGLCTFEAAHGPKIGWQAQYKPEHILEAADAEVELILANI